MVRQKERWTDGETERGRERRGGTDRERQTDRDGGTYRHIVARSWTVRRWSWSSRRRASRCTCRPWREPAGKCGSWSLRAASRWRCGTRQPIPRRSRPPAGRTSRARTVSSDNFPLSRWNSHRCARYLQSQQSTILFYTYFIFTSAKEDITFSPASVCLTVRRMTQKLPIKSLFIHSFIHHLLRQLAATYKYTVKYSCTINYIYIQ